MTTRTVKSNSWTGIDWSFGADQQQKREAERVATEIASTAAVLEAMPTPKAGPKAYVPIRYTEIKAQIPTYDRAALAEYAELAAVVGVAPPDMVVEEFKAFLVDSGMTVFDLATVVDFMDRKSEAEGRGWGWNWRPLRAKDARDVHFGTEADRGNRMRMLSRDGRGSMPQVKAVPASDHYAPTNGVYAQVVPIHALKKVAMIEASFSHPVAFMVSDYAPAPEFKADPFLMAVVPNGNLRSGVGRFVIDVWDEPGFGIEQMLKSGV